MWLRPPPPPPISVCTMGKDRRRRNSYINPFCQSPLNANESLRREPSIKPEFAAIVSLSWPSPRLQCTFNKSHFALHSFSLTLRRTEVPAGDPSREQPGALFPWRAWERRDQERGSRLPHLHLRPREFSPRDTAEGPVPTHGTKTP